MSTTADDAFRRDLDLAIDAYRLCNIDVRPRIFAQDAARRALVLLVRRLRACQFDVDDCVSGGASTPYKDEVRAFARALADLLQGTP